MPNLTGFELCRTLSSLSITQHDSRSWYSAAILTRNTAISARILGPRTIFKSPLILSGCGSESGKWSRKIPSNAGKKYERGCR